jgi:hypothetical protein
LLVGKSKNKFDSLQTDAEQVIERSVFVQVVSVVTPLHFESELTSGVTNSITFL